MQSRDRLIVALDRSSRDEILRLADALHGVAGVFKIGLQAFIPNGPSLVRELGQRGEKIFLDLKIHDIPNTAGHAVAEIAALGAAMTTVHAAGGEAMLRSSAHDDLLVLAVTVLTSLDAPVESVVSLARLAQQCGLRGVVASPLEIVAIRKACGGKLVIVTPGVRPEGSAAGDQRRTTTPAAAIAAGADYIVVGRPITDAPAPRDAALRIIERLDASLHKEPASSV
ncbi:MAG: orotidine-5'-phosphate decarboxylase [Acidobacteria bacterium]|nr:MAG: orotidine-5'-phosphate decarboxylase [Acidobacteriota bacterium]